MRRRRWFWLGLGLIAMLAGGCGYHLTGTGTGLPSHIRSISIPIFANNSMEPEIELSLTEAIRDEFIEDGRLRVVAGTGADAVLEGEILSYRLEGLAFDAADNITEGRLTVEVHLVLTDQVEGETLVNLRMPARYEYSVSEELAAAELARDEAEKEAFAELAAKLPGLVIEGF